MYVQRIISLADRNYLLRYPAVSGWTITKEAGNPLITIPSGETFEQYVPSPIKMPNGDIWVYAKGNSRIYAWKSTDGGASFSIQNGGVAVLTPGAGWDHDFVLEAATVYDEANDVIHLWYKGSVGGAWSWGHATAVSATPQTLTKDAGNPILTGAAVGTALGGTVTDFAISCVIKIGSTYHFYGYILFNSLYYLCQTTGTSFTTPTAAGLSLISRFDSSFIFETPSVIKAPNGSYLMLYAKGAAQPGARSVLSATSPDGVTWTAATGTVLAPTGSGWEQVEAYSGQFLKTTTGSFDTPILDTSLRWQYYYSGLSGGSVAQAGLARIAPGT